MVAKFSEPSDHHLAMLPSLLERAGIHPIRRSAITWCRANPVRAAELLSWNTDVLQKILEGIS